MLEAEGAHKRIDWPWKTEDGKRPSWRVIAAAVFLILGAIILILIASFEISYKAAFYPGSKIGKVDLSGLTREEAAVKLEKTVSRIDDGSIKVKLVGDGKDKLIVIDLPLSADSARTIINIDLNKTIEEGFKIGRSGNIIADLANQYFLAAGLRKLKAAISIDRQYLAGILNEQLAGDISKSVNAKPDIKCVADKCQIYIINESVGSGYDIGNGIEAWQTDLADLNPSFIVLNKKQLFPEVGRSEAEKLLPELEAIFISSSTP